MAQLLLPEQMADRALRRERLYRDHLVTCVPVAFLIVFLIVSILTAHVTAVACPYKELPGRVCMQIQEHKDALST